MTLVESTEIGLAQQNASDFACGLALCWHLACALDDEKETSTLRPIGFKSTKDREVAKSILQSSRERNSMFQIMAAMMEVTYGISA